LSIVVIEDDADVTRCIRHILAEEGFVVQAFTRADEALRWMRAHRAPPTLILLDLELPGIGGAAFRARQLCDPRLREVPVIVVSGSSHGAAEAEPLGAADFLAKPFTTEDLLHVVQNRATTLAKGEHFLRGAMRPPGR
jgi:CheY-like chemotaxis protein